VCAAGGAPEEKWRMSGLLMEPGALLIAGACQLRGEEGARQTPAAPRQDLNEVRAVATRETSAGAPRPPQAL